MEKILGLLSGMDKYTLNNKDKMRFNIGHWDPSTNTAPSSGRNNNKTKAKTRKRKKNAEKHVASNEEELPWPEPNEKTLDIYKDLLMKSGLSQNELPSSRLAANNEEDWENDCVPSSSKYKPSAEDVVFGGGNNSVAAATGGTAFSPIVGAAAGSGSALMMRTTESCMNSQSQCFRPQFCSTMAALGGGGGPEFEAEEEMCTVFRRPVRNDKSTPAPIGVFWDIENCSVPSGRSALVTVQRIRDRFFPGHYEAEFICVCDIRKEAPAVIQELNDAQVTIVHVSATSKNAADDKLRQSMRRFSDIYSGHMGCPSSPFPATMILISGDINFSTDLSDLKHRKRMFVILLHNKHAPEALLHCSHEHYDFHSFLGNLPPRPHFKEDNPTYCSSSRAMTENMYAKSKVNLKDVQQYIPLKGGLQPMDVLVCNLPPVKTVPIRIRLKKLSENCGGKVITIQGEYGLVRFPNKEAALRASKRMNGEDVLGSRIQVFYHSEMEFRNSDVIPIPSVAPAIVSPLIPPHSPPQQQQQHQVQILPPPPPPAPQQTSTPVANNMVLTPRAVRTSEVPFQPRLINNNNNGNGNIGSDIKAWKPTWKQRSETSFSSPKSIEVYDLHVTNIDPNLGDWKVVRHTLLTAFSEHVNVKGVWVYNAADGTVTAIVKVGTKDECHFAVAQLQRRKFGSKRIFISFDQGGNVDQETVKREVATLLHDVPGSSLPLFKFREMFEKRYRRSVSSSDLYRMKEVVTVTDNSGVSNGFGLGRTISLTNGWKSKEDKNLSLHCTIHPPKNCNNKIRTGWAEKEADILLPNVKIELRQLATRVLFMINEHEGSIPLISFMDCYEATYEKMEVVDSGSGVPLEHLLACVNGVEINMAENGMKRLRLIDRSNNVDSGILPHPQPLAAQLAQFGREMIDLLKTFPKCSLPFAKLIPAYHHHFGRQCRVADYGHFNLYSLLQTIPHVVQILGAGQNRILTLSHKAQMKRFATDLLRVLKAHGGVKKQIRISDFPEGFSQVFPNRQFSPEDYGLCHFSDLISQLMETTALVALVKDEEGNQMLAVPKREQTPQEMHRTRIFAQEVIELIRYSIRYEMPFSKFIPAYHHHFGRQCRVSDYGFTKLAELFEAISDTAVCITPKWPSSDLAPDDKIIRLVPQEQTKVVGEQVRKLVQKLSDQHGSPVVLNELEELFIDEHGFPLCPEMCDAADFEDLVVNKLSSYVKVENGCLNPVDQNEVRNMVADVVSILEKQPGYKMDLDDLIMAFRNARDMDMDLTDEMVLSQLSPAVIVSKPDAVDGKRMIELSPLRIFATELSQLLEDVGGSLLFSTLDSVYLQRFGRPIRSAQMGYPSLVALILAIPDVVYLRGKHRTKRVCLMGHSFSSEGSSFEESSSSFRSKSRHSSSGSGGRDWRSGNNGSNNGHHQGYVNGNPRSYSAEQCRPSNHLLKMDHGRWSESPQGSSQGHGGPLPQMYQTIPMPLSSPPFQRISNNDSTVFTFDRPPPMSPPMYDLWMREPMSPTTPVSPPVVWTFHPVVSYPPNTPPPDIMNYFHHHHQMA